MDELLRSAPKTLVALAAIVLGYLLIIAFNPPRTLCDEQLDAFRTSQKSFLYSGGKKVQVTAADEMFDLCKQDNGPGGCFDFFLNLRGMVDGLERIPKQCATTVGQDPVIKKWILRSLTLIAQVAWGEPKSPTFGVSKHGWLDAADFRLFCRTKVLANRFYGEEAFQVFRESVMSGLPGADGMSREQKWSRTIFSSPCE